ncbi:hypothetical protein SAMN05720469_12150 [Fibrobacter intestinalis]|uniref:RiboL-PSP-HEPN domain-containing protein n=1 Tax=Fibrobacter intestinalis TaxID=28122 RepID=A0A1M6W1B3_9BACT|nr:hypothetical protein [Fibrobacter intestinalis]SHK87581.1 hypothetical protein SAMN05720469_12150 [Fibrobacter intestinalis]
MKTAWNEFKNNIEDVKKIGAVYTQLVDIAPLMKEDLADLLRTQLVNAISAFDRLLHEYVRIGLLRQLSGLAPLKKITKNFMIDSDSFLSLMNLGTSPQDLVTKQRIIESRINYVLKFMTFQDPKKISEALSYIWDEEHKWQTLATELGKRQEDVISQLKLYVDRRNMIVHEADYDMAIPGRRPISSSIAQDCISFIYSLARQISIDAAGLSGI